MNKEVINSAEIRLVLNSMNFGNYQKYNIAIE
jgi:hypothetical protein